MKQNNTVAAFFELVRAGLWEKEAYLSRFGNIDYSELLRLAEQQSVVGLVAAGLEHVTDVKVPKEVALQFVGQALQLEQQNKAMNSFIATLVENMRATSIYTLLLKGQGVAQCYERPLWRSCGDVDLLLDEDNFAKAQRFLYPIASDYEPELKEEKHQEFTIGKWIVELHGNQPSHFSKKKDKVLEEIQESALLRKKSRVWKNGETNIPLLGVDDDIHFVFTHLLKHFFRGGIGLRQICDWCRLLWSFKDSINVSLLDSRLSQMGLRSEWHAFAALAVEWLGMPQEALPLYSSKAIWRRKANRIINFVLLTGNFGHNRDSSYYNKYPYLIGKVISLYWRSRDNIRYFTIFPLDSFYVLLWLIRHGMKNLIRNK